MFHDARQLPAGTTLEADVCIVGAGAAGITLAHSLRGRGMKVLLLESGGLELEEATQALSAGEGRGVRNYDLDASRLRMFGGTTTHWAGWSRPLEASDFTPPDPADLRRWPLRREELDPFYAQAQALCELGPYNYDQLAPWLEAGKLAALSLDPQRLKTALFQVSPPTRFGTTYREDLETAANIAVYLHANVLEVQADETASRVTGLRATSLGGAAFNVAARFYVLATGGLENARLLLLSNRVQKAGLGNGHDLVGRYFMDHPWLTDAGFVAFADRVPDLRLYLGETAALGTAIFGTLAPTAPEPGVGGYRVVLRPTRRIVEGVTALKAIGGAIGDLRVPWGFWRNLGSAFYDYDAVIDAGFKTLFGTKRSLFGTPEPGSGPIVGAFIDINVEQLPSPSSRVTLAASRDALGQNRIVLDWRPGAAEKRTMRRAGALVAQELGRLGIGRVRLKPLPDGDAWPDGLEGSRHHMGTTRMSEDPRTGVVDRNGRVHGIANLYIAGSSVFPSAGYANPTLTIVALALRLGETLRREFG